MLSLLLKLYVVVDVVVVMLLSLLLMLYVVVDVVVVVEVVRCC